MRVEHSIADHRQGAQTRANERTLIRGHRMMRGHRGEDIDERTLNSWENTDKRTQIRGQTRRHRQDDKDEKTQIRGQRT